MPRYRHFFKVFSIDGKYDVICSDSLLGINYKQIESVSVGYKTDHDMFSLDFEEFLWACGYGETLKDELLRNLIELEPFCLRIGLKIKTSK